MKYTIIKSDAQYHEYCDILEKLVFSGKENYVKHEDEIDLLTVLIEDYDRKHSVYQDMDPVEFLKSLMLDHKLRQQDISRISKVGKSTISEILNYKKKMSKDVIRRLSGYFNIRQEAFNRVYRLNGMNDEVVNTESGKVYNLSSLSDQNLKMTGDKVVPYKKGKELNHKTRIKKERSKIET